MSECNPQRDIDAELLQDVTDIVDRFKVAYKGRQKHGLTVMANALGIMIANTSHHDNLPCCVCSQKATGRFMAVVAEACAEEQFRIAAAAVERAAREGKI